MATKPKQTPPSDESVPSWPAWPGGTPILYADQISHVHMNGATAKLVLSTEVAQGKSIPIGMIVLPSHQAFAFAITLINAARDPALAPVIGDNALLAQQITALRQLLREDLGDEGDAPGLPAAPH